MVRIVTFADGFSSASVPSGASAQQENFTIANNTTSGAILTLDKNTEKSAFFSFELRRSDSLGSFSQLGVMQAVYNSSWSLSFGNFSGDDLVQDTITSPEHVKFSINATTGAITYDSGNMTGTGYSGTFKAYISRIL